MAGRLMVTGGGGLREYTWPGMIVSRRVDLALAGALCASGGRLYAADGAGGAILRMDGRTLAPLGRMAGGPGMAQLLAADGMIYALCADGDSLLMIEERSGEPLTLNRVGANPAAMDMDEAGRMIAIAGGECGMTALLDARTLDVVARLDMPGMAQGVAMHAGGVATMCLNDALDTTLVTDAPGGTRRMIGLGGMPGALLACEGALLAATKGRLYALSPDGTRVLAEIPAPGRARRLIFADGRVLLLDGLSEAIFMLRAGRWRRICEGARGMLLIADNMEERGQD